MKKKILIILALVSIIVLSGCSSNSNHHSSDWDKESCRIAGYEEPIEPDRKPIVKCRDECGSLEVGIHYRKLEILREFPDTKIQPDYIKEIRNKCCECECKTKPEHSCNYRFKICSQLDKENNLGSHI